MINLSWAAIVEKSRQVSTENGLTKPKIYPLTDYCLVEVSGEGAEKFLQGQLTCDVTTLDEQQGSYGACCTIVDL